jgi:hypothetical protein
MKTKIALVLVVLFCCGGSCSPEGKTPSRMCSGIYGGTNGQDTVWFCYVLTTGDIVDQDGVQMSVYMAEINSIYFTNDGLGGIKSNPLPGVQCIKSSGVTSNGGFVFGKGERNDWQAAPGYVVFSDMAVSNPKGSGRGRFDFRTRGPSPVKVALVSADGTIEAAPTVPSMATYTSREKQALDNITLSAQSSGIDTQPVCLVARSGNAGIEYFKEKDYFVPINLEDPNDYLKYASPFCYSWIFTTPEAMDNLVGSEYVGNVSSAACPNGISVKITVTASGIDYKTHVARTEYFLPVDSSLSISTMSQVDVYDRWTPFPDPNIWNNEQYVRSVKDDWLDLIDPNLYADPNICPDPNVFFRPDDPNFYHFVNRLDTTTDEFEDVMIHDRVMQIKILPVGQEDEINVRIDRFAVENILHAAPYWLTGNKMYDLNSDGIVNLRDFMEIEK